MDGGRGDPPLSAFTLIMQNNRTLAGWGAIVWKKRAAGGVGMRRGKKVGVEGG